MVYEPLNHPLGAHPPSSPINPSSLPKVWCLDLWLFNQPPPNVPPPEIAGLIKALLTIDFP